MSGCVWNNINLWNKTDESATKSVDNRSRSILMVFFYHFTCPHYPFHPLFPSPHPFLSIAICLSTFLTLQFSLFHILTVSTNIMNDPAYFIVKSIFHIMKSLWCALLWTTKLKLCDCNNKQWSWTICILLLSVSLSYLFRSLPFPSKVMSFCPFARYPLFFLLYLWRFPSTSTDEYCLSVRKLFKVASLRYCLHADCGCEEK